MNIIVIGDSWGVGEWPADDEIRTKAIIDYELIEHKGLAQYLEEAGHTVINLSKGAETNDYSLWQTELYLQRISKNIDVVYVFQTRFHADIDVNEYAINTTFRDLLSRYNTEFLLNLSTIAVRYGVKIKLIGGNSDVYTYPNLEIDFPGVSVVCQSFQNLLIHQNSEPDFPLFSGDLQTPNMNRKNSDELDKFVLSCKDFDYVLEYIDRAANRNIELGKLRELMWPDGWHPNRAGHKLLFDHLTKNDKSLIINNTPKD
tara:strand:- start:73 stop:846 length:774 start_codon:yes stop_codon:yes gene_type:complete